MAAPPPPDCATALPLGNAVVALLLRVLTAWGTTYPWASVAVPLPDGMTRIKPFHVVKERLSHAVAPTGIDK